MPELADDRLKELLALAHEVRMRWRGPEVEVEALCRSQTLIAIWEELTALSAVNSSQIAIKVWAGRSSGTLSTRAATIAVRHRMMPLPGCPDSA